MNIDKGGESLLQCCRKEILATTKRYIFFIMLYLTLKICKVTILKIGIRRPLNALIQEKVNLFRAENNMVSNQLKQSEYVK